MTRPEPDFAIDWLAAPVPPLRVHRALPDTVILRQSLAVSAEAPIMYLVFGSERALLLDTGDSGEPFPLRAVVDSLVDDWLAQHPVPEYGLVVAHTHAHGDHVAGDGQFTGRANTVVVGHDPASVADFFGIEDFRGALDLGDRTLGVIAIPGHEPSSIAVLDPASGLLFTGDTVYPGRLYVDDFAAFAASIDRLRDAADEVSWMLGAHVEMRSRPGRDHPIGSRVRRDEAPLALPPAVLDDIAVAASTISKQPGAHMFADFAIWNGPAPRAVEWHRARALVARILRFELARVLRR
jgi:hydroxyacylglutathione hydrolase